MSSLILKCHLHYLLRLHLSQNPGKPSARDLKHQEGSMTLIQGSQEEQFRKMCWFRTLSIASHYGSQQSEKRDVTVSGLENLVSKSQTVSVCMVKGTAKHVQRQFHLLSHSNFVDFCKFRFICNKNFHPSLVCTAICSRVSPLQMSSSAWETVLVFIIFIAPIILLLSRMTE